MSNDTQPLADFQVPEEAPYQAYDKPVEPDYLSDAFQKARAAHEELLRKRSEEDAKLLTTERPDLDYPDEKQAYLKKWGPIAEQQFKAEPKPMPNPHIHGPFTFLLNQNHNALRGCQSCGAAWVGSMAGNEENLRWHPVYEIEEEE